MPEEYMIFCQCGIDQSVQDETFSKIWVFLAASTKTSSQKIFQFQESGKYLWCGITVDVWLYFRQLHSVWLYFRQLHPAYVVQVDSLLWQMHWIQNLKPNFNELWQRTVWTLGLSTCVCLFLDIRGPCSENETLWLWWWWWWRKRFINFKEHNLERKELDLRQWITKNPFVRLNGDWRNNGTLRWIKPRSVTVIHSSDVENMVWVKKHVQLWRVK